MYSTEKYDITELASYAHPGDPRIQQIPWKVFPVMPHPDDNEGRQKYDSCASYQFGEWKFEEACLKHKSHIVCDLRDHWMLSHEETSPFRSCYYWLCMPTCDAYPQNEQWISTYQNMDAVFTYQDWSKDVLHKQSGGRINLIGSASPCASPAFQPIRNRIDMKRQLGFQNHTIIGTTMRNQRRKLYPQLFRSFRRFLNQTGRNDILLYCHTSYPDAGWDLPKLILEHNLSSKVLLTYICKECKQAFPTFFNDATMHCLHCNKPSAHICSVQMGVPDEILCRVYNMMDLYVQYANSEGFGLPIVEAAACGTPIFAVDYSAMSDVVRRLDGVPIKVYDLELEVETGCYRALPDDDHFIQELGNFLLKSPQQHEHMREMIRKAYEQNYSWDITAQKWMDHIDSINIEKYEQAWKRPPRIAHSEKNIPQELDNVQFTRWLIAKVLCEPERLGSYMETRLIRDLNYGFTTSVMGGMYFNELAAMSNKPSYQPFSRKDAYTHMVNLCNRRNHWEQLRWKSLGH